MHVRACGSVVSPLPAARRLARSLAPGLTVFDRCPACSRAWPAGPACTWWWSCVWSAVAKPVAGPFPLRQRPSRQVTRSIDAWTRCHAVFHLATGVPGRSQPACLGCHWPLQSWCAVRVGGWPACHWPLHTFVCVPVSPSHATPAPSAAALPVWTTCMTAAAAPPTPPPALTRPLFAAAVAVHGIPAQPRPACHQPLGGPASPPPATPTPPKNQAPSQHPTTAAPPPPTPPPGCRVVWLWRVQTGATKPNCNGEWQPLTNKLLWGGVGGGGWQGASCSAAR